MTEASPKKPRKKAALKTEAPEAETQTPPRDDQQMREAVLAAALPHAAFDGFTDSVLQNAGVEAGVAKPELARLFENGPTSLVEFYSTHTDVQMEKRLGEMDLKAMKIRERIATAVKTRLAILKPHKEAARRAAAFLSLPVHAALGAKLMYHTVDSMWRAAVIELPTAPRLEPMNNESSSTATPGPSWLRRFRREGWIWKSLNSVSA